MSWSFETLVKGWRVIGAIADQGDGAIVPTSMFEELFAKDRRSFEPIMRRLRSSKLVKSHPGTNGGYSLPRAMHLISYLDLTKMAYGAIGLARCARDANAPMCEGCAAVGECYFRDVYTEVRTASENVLRAHYLRRPPQ